MEVYRVETRYSVIEAGKSFGPYSYYPDPVTLQAVGYHWDNLLLDFYDDEIHPEPWADGIEDFDIINHLCGFASLTDLYRWFDSSLSHLINGGFFITVYEVAEEFIMLGNKQLAFIGSKATLVNCKFF